MDEGQVNINGQANNPIEQLRREALTASFTDVAEKFFGGLKASGAPGAMMAALLQLRSQQTIITDLVAKLGGEVTLDPFDKAAIAQTRSKRLRTSMAKDGKLTFRLETVTTPAPPTGLPDSIGE